MNADDTIIARYHEGEALTPAQDARLSEIMNDEIAENLAKPDKLKRGGLRVGAGRPAGTTKEDSKTDQVNVRLTPEQRAKAERIGDGKAADGLRRALDAWRS